MSSLLDDQRQIYKAYGIDHHEGGPPLLPHGDDPHAVGQGPPRRRRGGRGRRKRRLEGGEGQDPRRSRGPKEPLNDHFSSSLKCPPPPSSSSTAVPAHLQFPPTAASTAHADSNASTGSINSTHITDCEEDDDKLYGNLPDDFGSTEIRLRALAAYATIRTLSLPLRLSPFTPLAFLRALYAPLPTRLLSDVHVHLLRFLCSTTLGHHYHSGGVATAPPSSNSSSSSSSSNWAAVKRRADGLRYPLRATDRLDQLDRYTWPVYLDDYCHLTADLLYASLHDPTNYAADLVEGEDEPAHGDNDDEEDDDDSNKEGTGPGSSTRLVVAKRVTHRNQGGKFGLLAEDQGDVVVADDLAFLAEAVAVEDEGEFVDDDSDEDFVESTRRRTSKRRRSARRRTSTAAKAMSSTEPAPAPRKRGRPRKRPRENGSSTDGCRPSQRSYGAAGELPSDVLVSRQVGPQMARPQPASLCPPATDIAAAKAAVEASLHNTYAWNPSAHALSAHGHQPRRLPLASSYQTWQQHQRFLLQLPSSAVAALPLPQPQPQPLALLQASVLANVETSHYSPSIQSGTPVGESACTAPLAQAHDYQTLCGSTSVHPAAPLKLDLSPCSFRINEGQAHGSKDKSESSPGAAPTSTDAAPEGNLRTVEVERPPQTQTVVVPLFEPSGVPEEARLVLDSQNALQGADETTSSQQPAPMDSCSTIRNYIRGRTTSAHESAEGPEVMARGDRKVEKRDEHASEPSPWRHFDPLKRMRCGTPYHHLSVEEKLVILEFLIDELLDVESIADEFNRRRLALDDVTVPYGKGPSEAELANLENADECAVCLQEGELLCCDGCPSSYHRACVCMSEHDSLPEGKWLCPECLIPDPARFGTLLGGRKSQLDWFPLDDIASVYQGTNELNDCRNVVDKDDELYLVVHGFVFCRRIFNPANQALHPNEQSSVSFHQLRHGDMRRTVSRVFASTGDPKPWPFTQIPDGAFSLTEEVLFNPCFYSSRYRSFDSHSLDFESTCSAAHDTSRAAHLFGRDMGTDKALAEDLMSGVSLFNPFHVVATFLRSLECELSKACLLDEVWCVNLTTRKRHEWYLSALSCRTVREIAHYLMELVDAIHPRAFSDIWFKPVASRLQGVSTALETMYGNDEAFPLHEVSEESLDFASRIRNWQRSSLSDVKWLLARDSLQVVDLLDGESIDAAAAGERLKVFTTKSRKRKALEVFDHPRFDSGMDDSRHGKPELLESSFESRAPSRNQVLGTATGSEEGAEKSTFTATNGQKTVPNADPMNSVKLRRRSRGELSFTMKRAKATGGNTSSRFDELLLETRNRRMTALLDEAKLKTVLEVSWPVAGSKPFPPAGSLPQRAIKFLARRAGAVVAPFLTYSAAYEVGQASVYHSWRKRVLSCRSYDELMMLVRFLKSALDASVIRKCTSISQRLQKPKARSTAIVKSQRDLRSGIQYYLVQESGRTSARWESSLSVELSALVRVLSKCRKLRLAAANSIRIVKSTRSNKKSRSTISGDGCRVRTHSIDIATPGNEKAHSGASSLNPIARSSLNPNAEETTAHLHNVRGIVRSFRDAFTKLYMESRPGTISEHELKALRDHGLNGLKRLLQSIGQMTNSDLLIHLRKVEEDARKRIETKLLATPPDLYPMVQVQNQNNEPLLRAPAPGTMRSSGDLPGSADFESVSSRKPPQRGGLDGGTRPFDEQRFEAVMSGYGLPASALPPTPLRFPSDDFTPNSVDSSSPSQLSLIELPQPLASSVSSSGVTSHRAVETSNERSCPTLWNRIHLKSARWPAQLEATTSIPGAFSDRLHQMRITQQDTALETFLRIGQEDRGVTQQQQDRSGMRASMFHRESERLSEHAQQGFFSDYLGFDGSQSQAPCASMPEPRAFATNNPFETIGPSSATRGYLPSTTAAHSSSAHPSHLFPWNPITGEQPTAFDPSQLVLAPSFESPGRWNSSARISQSYEGRLPSGGTGMSLNEFRSPDMAYALNTEHDTSSQFPTAFASEPSGRPDPNVLEGIGLTAAQLQLLLQHGYDSSLGGHYA